MKRKQHQYSLTTASKISFGLVLFPSFENTNAKTVNLLVYF